MAKAQPRPRHEPPRKPLNKSVRKNEYLERAKVEHLMKAANKLAQLQRLQG